VPGAHNTSPPDPGGQYDPEGHAWQLPTPVCPAKGLYVPEGQLVHTTPHASTDVDPVPLVVVPLGQSVQLGVVPCKGVYVPFGQKRHALSLELLPVSLPKVPAGQRLQDVELRLLA